MKLTVIQESNRFPVRSGWVWQECLVRLPDGDVAWYDIPLHPLGADR